MEGVIWEWIDFSIRWLHVVAGIAWIGSSFYFVHLDLSLKQAEGMPDKAGGEAWQVHVGGFYHMVKYMVAPARMPDGLTTDCAASKSARFTRTSSGFIRNAER